MTLDERRLVHIHAIFPNAVVICFWWTDFVQHSFRERFLGKPSGPEAVVEVLVQVLFCAEHLGEPVDREELTTGEQRNAVESAAHGGEPAP